MLYMLYTSKWSAANCVCVRFIIGRWGKGAKRGRHRNALRPHRRRHRCWYRCCRRHQPGLELVSKKIALIIIIKCRAGNNENALRMPKAFPTNFAHTTCAQFSPNWIEFCHFKKKPKTKSIFLCARFSNCGDKQRVSEAYNKKKKITSVCDNF